MRANLFFSISMNSKGYNPYRDSKGRFDRGPIKAAASSYNKILKLQEDLFWAQMNPQTAKIVKEQMAYESRRISNIYKNVFKSNGLSAEYSKQRFRLNEWSRGNGYRDSKTGLYKQTPALEKFKDSPAQKLHSAITQSILKEAGVKEITVYRGEREGLKAKGLTSFTDHPDVAQSFGNVKKKTVSVDKVVAHHLLDSNFRYKSENEVILDL